METNPASPTNPPGRSRKSLFTWRTARLLLVSAAVLATLVAIFYTEENWRGKRAWEKCRRELEPQGVSYDWDSFIPPPVPDEQNIFKAPGMGEWFVGRKTNSLSERLANPITSSIGTTNAIQTEADAREYLAWSDQFEPDFNVVRAALKRPYARFDCNYDRPAYIDIPNFKASRIVAQTLAQRTHSYLLLGQPDKALREITMVNDLCRIFEGAPTGQPMTLVAAMINVAVRGLYANTVAEGLRTHVWREPQLSMLQLQLEDINLVPFLVRAFRCERAASLRTIEVTPRAELVKMFRDAADSGSERWKFFLLKYAPKGWFYQNMVTYAVSTHAQLKGHFPDRVIDGAMLTVSPRDTDETQRVLLENAGSAAPYKFLTFWFTPNYTRAVQRLARNQTSVNQTAVACALERYRLAHGKYPETLSALTPEFIAKLPRDMIGGQPLRYRSATDGTFTLYSIGWNGNDDGGITATGKSEMEDLENGDWVWPARK